MLPRYTTNAMAAIWNDDARYARWRHVEIAVLEARVALGLTPSEVLAAVIQAPTPTGAEVGAVEAEVRHDVLAFLYSWTDQMDPDVAAHIHRDLTSSDVVDTSQALALGAATDLIVLQARQLIVSLADKALAGPRCVWHAHTRPAGGLGRRGTPVRRLRVRRPPQRRPAGNHPEAADGRQHLRAGRYRHRITSRSRVTCRQDPGASSAGSHDPGRVPRHHRNLGRRPRLTCGRL